MIRQLLGAKTAVVFGAIALLLAIPIYIGEKVIRANPEWIPVKAQLRSYGYAGASGFHPDPDPYLGFGGGPPLLRTWRSTQDYEFFAESDAHGFPNRMPLPQTAEILVLGDSLVGGPGVGIDGQFSTLVGESLPNSRIVNLAIAGAAPNRQLRAYRKFGASFRPRLVVSCIWLAADLDGQLHFDSWLRDGANGEYNKYRLELNDRLQPKSLWTFWSRVQRRSYLAGKLTELALRWWGIQDRISFASGPPVLLDIDSLRALARTLDPQDYRILSMIGSLKEMKALSQSGGADFLVLLIPSKEEIYGASFMPEVMKPAQTLEQRLREEGLPVLSTYDAVRDRAKHQSAFFPHDIHLTALGHRIVSDSLVDWLKQSKSLSGDKNAVKTSKFSIDS